tara:strand:+ start:119 stop:421 length:303 start_codon:yes stop_codon:yes gene_type:complete
MKVKYKVNGEELTPEEFKARKVPGIDTKNNTPSNVQKEWEGHFCEGSAVHPKDIKAAEAHAAKHGVPTYFDNQGRPNFTSMRHQSSYLKLIGMHNKDGVM